MAQTTSPIVSAFKTLETPFMFKKALLAAVLAGTATSAFAQSGAAQFKAYKLAEAVDEKCHVLTLESRSLTEKMLRQMLFHIVSQSNSAEAYNQAEADIQKDADLILANGCSAAATDPAVKQALDWVNAQGDFALAVLNELPFACQQYRTILARRGPIGKNRLMAVATDPAQRQGIQAALTAQIDHWSAECATNASVIGGETPYSKTPMVAVNAGYRYVSDEPEDVTDAQKADPWKFRRSDKADRTPARIDEWSFLTNGREHDLLISAKADGTLVVEARDGTRLTDVNAMVLEVQKFESKDKGATQPQRDLARLESNADGQVWTLSKDKMDDLLAQYGEKGARVVYLRIDMSDDYAVYPGLTGSEYRYGSLSFASLKSGLVWAQAPKP